MKSKFKYAIVVMLIVVIVYCLISLLGSDKGSKDIRATDKGSYSYYYSEPSMPTELSKDGINFYDK